MARGAAPWKRPDRCRVGDLATAPARRGRLRPQAGLADAQGRQRHLSICHVPRGGIAWRKVPDSFPLWGTVRRWFARLRDDGTWETANHYRVKRERAGREASPTAAGVESRGSPDIDSQSVKTTESGGGLRCGRESQGPQAARDGGHRRPGAQAPGPRRRHPGSGWGRAAPACVASAMAVCEGRRCRQRPPRPARRIRQHHWRPDRMQPGRPGWVRRPCETLGDLAPLPLGQLQPALGQGRRESHPLSRSLPLRRVRKPPASATDTLMVRSETDTKYNNDPYRDCGWANVGRPSTCYCFGGRSITRGD